MAPCQHKTLHLDVSSHAAEAGFVRPPLAKRRAATTPSGRVKSGDTDEHARLESLFPGPLVLPDDGLAIDPKEPPQSLRSWIAEKARNPLTQRRKTIYVVSPPEAAPELEATLSRWTLPFVLKVHPRPSDGCNPPRASEVSDYLKAFYHPLPIDLMLNDMRFIPWDDDSKPTNSKSSKQQEDPGPQYIGLQIGTSVTRIRTRPCPDAVFPRQLNLNDILDAAIESLPADAYAMVMLTHHDLYEDDDDDFCCGRAYGGSRVAVVSSARYHPYLDAPGGIDREHMWPFSHCQTYVDRLCKEAAANTKQPAHANKRQKTTPPSQPPPTSLPSNEDMAPVIQAGLTALEPSAPHSATGQWLARVMRTVAHEVGHCFCLAHCSYYACVMQGTAGIAEDLRQPPYLCLLCLAKLTRAVRDVEGGRFVDEKEYVVERYEKLAAFCAGYWSVGMLAGYKCWLERRIEVVKALGGITGRTDQGAS